MIIFRPHKGGLKESLEHKKEFSSEQEMKEYIFNQWKLSHDNIAPFSVEDIVISDDSVDDARCGWHDTRYVCIKRYGSENYIELYGAPQCIGMCATKYER